MDGALTLRPGLPADFPAILDIWVAAWSQTMPAIDFEARRPWMAERLRRMLAKGAALTVAERQGAIGGAALVDLHEACLDQLVVAPAEWGSGTAQRLVAHAKLVSPQGLKLTVNADNPRAIRLYEREGFTRTGDSVNLNSGLPTHIYQWTPSATGVSSPN